MALSVWYDGDEARVTSAEDLKRAFECWNRLDVLLAVMAPPMPVGDLAGALDIGRTLASMHLATLARAGAARMESQGKQRFYRLTDAAQIQDTSEGLVFRLRSGDGCWMMMCIAHDCSVMRLLQRGYRLAFPPGARAEHPAFTAARK